MYMKALITGASSGIGKEMAMYLSEKGIDSPCWAVVAFVKAPVATRRILFNFLFFS